MKNISLFFILIFIYSFFVSCEDSNKKIYNVPFGSSREELVTQFEKFNMFPDSTSKQTKVVYNHGKYDFGGFVWDEIEVYFSRDDKFGLIRFCKKFDNPQKALKSFEDLKQTLSLKYELKLEKSVIGEKDILVGRINRRNFSIVCYNDTIKDSLETTYYNYLQYEDKNYHSRPYEEL